MIEADVIPLNMVAGAEEREERFRALVASHRERAVRLAWRLLGGDLAVAEDVAQDAFLRAYRGLPRFREESSLDTWFYRILVRQAESYRRWRRVRALWTTQSEAEPADPSPPVQSDPVVRRRIAMALSRLPAGQRQVFVLVHMEGFTVEESALLLGKAVGTVKSHLHRALTALRADLADLREVTGGNRT
jgi:RNA polymerase sigma-70 factor (ECF subfamily)